MMVNKRTMFFFTLEFNRQNPTTLKNLWKRLIVLKVFRIKLRLYYFVILKGGWGFCQNQVVDHTSQSSSLFSGLKKDPI